VQTKGETMSQFKNQIRVTMALGFLSILVGILSHLALTDIYHGGEDLTLEWNVLRLGAVIFFVFVVTSLLIMGRALKAML
jgi:hypothetical protein